jgi:hypothetical protein
MYTQYCYLCIIVITAVLDYTSVHYRTAVRIRLCTHSCMHELVASYAAVCYSCAAVQIRNFVYVGTGSEVPVPGQKYRFNNENSYKLVHM